MSTTPSTTLSTPVHQSTRYAQIGAALDMGERFSATRNIRRPIVTKQAFSRTSATAAREDGVDTRTVTRRFA